MNFVRLLKIKHRVFHLEIVSLIFFSILVLNDVFYLVGFFYSTECSNKVLSLQLLLFKMDHETVGADDPRPESPIDNPLQCRYCGKVFTR